MRGSPTPARKPATRRRKRRWGLRLLVVLTLASAVLWIASTRSTLGMGVDLARTPAGWGPSDTCAELSLAPGTLLIALGSSRVEILSAAGAAYSIFYPLGQKRVYIVDADRIQPAPGYIYVPPPGPPGSPRGVLLSLPFALLTPLLGVATFLVWRRSAGPDPARCPACGYATLGLPEGAKCPECGAGAT